MVKSTSNQKSISSADRLAGKETRLPDRTDKPSSFYLTPKKVGTKIKTTGAKVQSEDEVVKQCTEYLRRNGWITKTQYTGGIMVGSGKYVTNPAKGQPDSINFHIGKKLCVYIEYKKSHGGLLSSEQKEYINLLTHCGHTVWVVNSLKLLKEFLETLEVQEVREAS